MAKVTDMFGRPVSGLMNGVVEAIVVGPRIVEFIEPRAGYPALVFHSVERLALP